MSTMPSDSGRAEPSALFSVGEPAAATEPVGGGRPRFQAANRQQIEFRAAALDELVPEDHPVRSVWEYVCPWDLSELYATIQAVAGHPGRPPIDPKILLCLWLYATIDGVGSARALERRCEEHLIYQWICGGVSVNHHTLSDFRALQVALLDRLLTQSVAVLMQEGLVTLERVAQDGMRVRASAGAASFHRRPTLEEHWAAAQEQVDRLRAELEDDPAAASRRQQAARRRAAAERSERLQRALAQLPEREAKKKPAEREQARTSSTDPDARVMKMADGGFRPAYNVQFATDTPTQVITAVEVVNSGSDRGQMAPMVEQHQQRYGQVPAEYLVDGGFVTKENIEEVSGQAHEGPPRPEGGSGGTTVYAPVPATKDAERERFTPLPSDTPAVAAWRKRRATPEAKEIFQQRAATAECVNAHARNRGLRQFLVRGLAKVKAVALWYALAQNLLRTLALRAAVAPVAA